MKNFERVELHELNQPYSFIIPIEEYRSPSSRIQGFQELFNFNLTAPNPTLVLGDNAFRSYLTSGDILPEVEEDIRKAFRMIREQNPTRGAYWGRAFFVPGIDNPNGPRTAAIFDEEAYLGEVRRFYQFVIDRGYHQKEGSDIALISHPFIHAMDKREFYGNAPIREGEILPWSAGYAVPNPVPGREHQIRIVATFGPDEAVQSVPTDQYDVDTDRRTITQKRIGFKDVTIVPRTGSTYESLEIPLSFQNEQALTDAEILLVAQEAMKAQGRRIEFIMQSDGVYVREIAPWEPIDERTMVKLQPDAEIIGPIVRITDETDIERIPDGEAIVFMGPETFQKRTTDLFARVASRQNMTAMVALVHGTIETSHQARILTDTPHISVKLTGDQDFKDGDVVRVKCDAEKFLRVEYLNPYEYAIIPLSDVQRLAKGEAGQKVARLAMMRHHGLLVPDGFAISSKAIQRYLLDIGLSEQVARLDTIDIHNARELENLTDAIQAKLFATPLPASLEEQIRQAATYYGFPSYAIRSSGSEDGASESRAGLYESVMNVAPADVADKLRETIASYFSPASIIAIRTNEQLPSHMVVGVGIHEFIPETPQTVGAVVFSYRDSILIEATKGSPEGIVSGKTKDYIRIKTIRTDETWSIDLIGKPDITLSEEQIKQILEVTGKIEEIFQSYQDIELLTSPEGLFIVQARPR